jgi:hypothetical protein
MRVLTTFRINIIQQQQQLGLLSSNCLYSAFFASALHCTGITLGIAKMAGAKRKPWLLGGKSLRSWAVNLAFLLSPQLLNEGEEPAVPFLGDGFFARLQVVDVAYRMLKTYLGDRACDVSVAWLSSMALSSYYGGMVVLRFRCPPHRRISEPSGVHARETTMCPKRYISGFLWATSGREA